MNNCEIFVDGNNTLRIIDIDNNIDIGAHLSFYDQISIAFDDNSSIFISKNPHINDSDNWYWQISPVLRPFSVESSLHFATQNDSSDYYVTQAKITDVEWLHEGARKQLWPIK